MLVDQSPSFAGKRIAVVGAGLMGRMMAYALAKGGAQVSLYDRGGADGEHAAAMVAAAMLAPLAESAITEANVVQMGMYSLPRWQSLTAELSLPVFFSARRNGLCLASTRCHRSQTPYGATAPQLSGESAGRCICLST